MSYLLQIHPGGRFYHHAAETSQSIRDTVGDGAATMAWMCTTGQQELALFNRPGEARAVL